MSKQFQFFKELLPNLTRLGFIGLTDTAVKFSVDGLGAKGSPETGLRGSMYEVSTPADVESAIASGQRDDVSAFFVSLDPRFVAAFPTNCGLSRRTGKPAFGQPPSGRGPGCLMSYYNRFR